MDLKARLAKLEERRGETSDEWMAKFYERQGGDSNEELLKLTQVLAEADPNTTAEVIDLIGGLEHYRPYESVGDTPFFFTGMENISDTIVRIFDRIIAFIKKWIKVFVDAEFKLSLHTALHSHSLENIRTNMRTASRKPKDRPTFTVGTRIVNLSVNYRPINNVINLINGLTVLKAVADLYFISHSETVMGRVNQVVSSVNGQKDALFLADLMRQVSPVNIGTASVMKADEEGFVSPHLMGNHKFMVTNTNRLSTDQVDQIAGTRIKMVPSQLTPVEAPPAISFEYFDHNMTEAVLTKCDAILATLSKSNNGTGRHARKQALASLLASIERVNEEVQRNGVRSEEDARRVVAVLESYVAWIADPYTSIYAYVLRNVRAALNVCEANIA
ncbi:internal head protein [Pseudomonas phage D6]|nr:internal head protein [Pseudomonas phage D6]